MTSPVVTGGTQDTLITALQRPGCYRHAATDIELFETHISWVLLAGKYAYKVKKALKLEFLDFSTLEKRRHFCEEELRLNSRWAPQLYLEVVPICGSAEDPVIDGDGDVIEYALRMLRFPQDAQLDRQLDAGLLTYSDMRDLAQTVARYHEEAPVFAYKNDADALAHVRDPMLDNFAPLAGIVDAAELERLQGWTEQRLDLLEPVLVGRRRDGLVRECHADLHLTNLVRLSSGIVAYDCVEFDAGLRNVDVISDLSFLVMDLIVRDRRDLGFEFLNRYLECSGDYAGLAVFGLYLVYHCLIRAKIAAIRCSERSDEAGRRGDLAELAHYIGAAIAWLDRPEPQLIAMHGYCGSGKTWLSGRLLRTLPAIRVRSDTERKRSHGLQELATSASAPGQGIYTEAATRNLYDHLQQLAAHGLLDGHHVIVDASFLMAEQREAIAAFAAQHDVPLLILDARADEDELVRRLKARSAGGAEVSEADTSILEFQYQNAERLDEKEESRTLHVATSSDVDIDRIRDRILERARARSVQ